MSICYLNGEFMPVGEARVSVLDRGFVFGDGVYEVVPVYGGHFFRLEQHLARLEHSMAAIRLPNPLRRAEWASILADLVSRNGGGDQAIYLQITRGVAERDHRFPADAKPTLFAMSQFPAARKDLACISAVTLEDIRWKLCNIKAITLLPNVLLRQQAEDAGAAEAILVRDGLVTEGTASNVFIVADGVVKTPPKGPRLLPGITRDLLLELLAREGISFSESDFSLEELRNAEEVWLTGSIRELALVVTLDGKAVGSGQAGPLGRRAFALYQEFKAAVAHEQQAACAD